MDCIFCGNEMIKDKMDGFVCVCNKCLEMLEKEDKRRTELICRLSETIKQYNEGRKE